MRFKKFILTLLPVLGWSITVPATAQLPQLTPDPAIQKGTLPCGVTYYMVPQPQDKGYAHIAVVQRDDPPSRTKREALQSAFFGRMGIAPPPEGFLQEVDGSTVYRFPRVPVYRKEVLDSTLLYTFARVAECKAQQAVIVSGDIDPVELGKKMGIFSMLVPRMLVRENHKPDYVWEPSPAPVVRTRTDGPAAVRVSYASARIPFVLMNTTQALVTDRLGAEFLVLLQHRLERNFRDAGIPYGAISFSSLRSADHGGDERYSVNVTVPARQLDPAMRLIAGTLGEMDAFGVSVLEFTEAKQVLKPQMRRRAAQVPGAEEYTQRCIAHFLYGANLTSREEALRYFSRRTMPDSTATRLFNGYCAALLDQLSNLTLEYTGAPESLDPDDALFYYNLAYLYGSVSGSGKDYAWHGADTLSLPSAAPKVRLKGERTEAVTGGTLWTFSNGLRVIYKQVKGSGSFSYALQLNGGLAQVPGLREGEGGHIGRLLNLYDVAGMPASAFRDMLAANGISLDAHLALNSMNISGQAPASRLALLLKVLVALAKERVPNAAEFQAYCKWQRLLEQDLNAELFRYLNPGYAHTPYPQVEALSEDTRGKADKFYEERFARLNDGVLILCGDLPEESTRKLLLRQLGAFPTARGNTLRRPVEMRSLSGVTTCSGPVGPKGGFHLLLDTPYALTTEHFYTAQVAVEALRTELGRHLAGYGYSPSVELLYCTQPQERFQVRISCMPIPVRSLPEDVAEISPERALTAVRAALRSAAAKAPQEEDVRAWKENVRAAAEADMSTPDGFVRTLLARYSANKDITTHYREAVENITPGSVQAFLYALERGGRVEYLVK